MRKERRFASQKARAAMMAAALVLSMGMPAMAEGSNYSETIGGATTTTFDKYLVMDKEAEVPNATFTYAVTAGTAKAYELNEKKFEILAGVDAENVTMAGVGSDDAAANTIVYKQGDTISNDANPMVKNYNSATKKYVKKTATLDFSACKFKEPGVYRYVITESGDNQGVTNDEDLTRIVDVYVNDDSNETEKKLAIAGYVLHSNEDDITMGDGNGTVNTDPTGKSQGFTNTYDTSDLTIRKEVSGNQASHDKYFEFTVEITEAKPGTVYQVDLTGAEAVSGTNSATIEANTGKINPTTLTVGEEGTVTGKFYLQHGQEIKIQGLAKDTTYNVTENAEDYKSTAAGVTGYTDEVEGTIASADLKTSYLNTRDGAIPTGVVMTVAPFAAVTLLGGIGAVSIIMKKKNDD